MKISVWFQASFVLVLLASTARAPAPGESFTHPATECAESEPDCDLTDWSIPKKFCEKDCNFEYKRCFEPIARWTYGSVDVTMGSCDSILCDNVGFLKGRDGAGCLDDAARDQCDKNCTAAKDACHGKCVRCRQDCMCSCHAVIDTCKDMCEIKYEACTSHHAPVLCNWTAHGQACCESERHWCKMACDYTAKCQDSCWRSFTYAWQEPGLDRQCARTCGTSEIWPTELYFLRTLLGTLEESVTAVASDSLIQVRTSRDDLVPGNLVRLGSGNSSELLKLISVSQGVCSGQYPLSSSSCVLTLQVQRSQGSSDLLAHSKGDTVFLLPCFTLNGPEPMCTEIHNTLCQENMLSWKACP
mmetsp:Transcript_56483/g.82888  ORF Transcript_56483/g.82888 Transcript_56483/m.82888 type:complete len:357 (-) Transcript_56483:309-1379(-)